MGIIFFIIKVIGLGIGIKFLSRMVLLFVYFPIVAILDRSTALEKLKDKFV